MRLKRKKSEDFKLIEGQFKRFDSNKEHLERLVSKYKKEKFFSSVDSSQAKFLINNIDNFLMKTAMVGLDVKTYKDAIKLKRKLRMIK